MAGRLIKEKLRFHRKTFLCIAAILGFFFGSILGVLMRPIIANSMFCIPFLLVSGVILVVVGKWIVGENRK